MTTQKSLHRIVLARLTAHVASVIVALVGGMVLVGWAFDIVVLKSVLPHFVTMKANTALAFMLAGGALWLVRREETDHHRRPIAYGCPGAVVCLGLLTLCEYVFGWDLRIDNLMFQDPSMLFPGRMAPATALCFVLSGAALLLIDVETRKGHRPAQSLSLLCGLIAGMAALSYLYNVELVYRLAFYSSMAMHTTLTFAVLSVGTLCARPNKGVMAVFMSDTVGGVVVRRLLSPALAILVVLGWARLIGQRAGLYDTEFGLTLMVMASCVVLALLVWSNARSLDRTDTARTRAEDALQVKEEEIRAMTQQLWQAAKFATMGEMAASVAHELNNPLATVSLRIEALLARLSTQDSKRGELEIVAHEVDRMSTLVANLLEFGRRSGLQISTLDVCAEIAKTLELIQYQFRQRRITVVQEFAPDVPMVHADRQQFRQLLLNLFTNASDAMLQGGTLTIRAHVTEKHVVVEVADTGVGIVSENIPRVMEPFFTTKLEGKGTGLGLTICRRIAYEHHGALEIVSDGLGQGATVRLTLPKKHGINAAAIVTGV